MAHRLKTRLDDDLAAKLAAVRRATKQTTTDVVRAALELYYERVTKGSAASMRRVFEETGFIGCADGPADLSGRYKDYLTKGLRKKT